MNNAISTLQLLMPSGSAKGDGKTDLLSPISSVDGLSGESIEGFNAFLNEHLQQMVAGGEPDGDQLREAIAAALQEAELTLEEVEAMIADGQLLPEEVESMVASGLLPFLPPDGKKLPEASTAGDGTGRVLVDKENLIKKLSEALTAGDGTDRVLVDKEYLIKKLSEASTAGDGTGRVLVDKENLIKKLSEALTAGDGEDGLEEALLPFFPAPGPALSAGDRKEGAERIAMFEAMLERHDNLARGRNFADLASAIVGGKKAEDGGTGLAEQRGQQQPASVTVVDQARGGPPVQENSATQSRPVLDLPTQIGRPNWDQALGNRVLWMVNQQQSSAELRLNPPHLGPIEVRVTMEGDRAQITFTAQHGPVREAIDAAIPRLREMFADSGVDLGQVNVSSQGAGDARNGALAGDRSGGGGGGEEVDADEGDLSADSSSGEGLIDYYA